MAMALNTTFMSVKQVLTAHLKSKTIYFSNYKDRGFALNCAVTSFDINDAGKGVQGDNSSNVTVNISYTAVVAADKECVTADKTMTINILSNINDYKWGPIMRARVWRNDYPSAVGIEDVTGMVYLVYLREFGIEFCGFAKLDDGAMAALETLHRDAPYEIKVRPETLFDCLEGDIGNKALRDNVYIAFNCMPPLNVYAEKSADEVVNTANDIVKE